MPRHVGPCAVCSGPYAQGRCFTNPGCPRNTRRLRELFGRRPRNEGFPGVSSGAPLAAGGGRHARAARQYPLHLYVAAGDYGNTLHRTRTTCQTCAAQHVLGGPRAVCSRCEQQRSVFGRWFVDDQAAHVRADCMLLDRNSSRAAYQCAECFTLVDAAIP